VSQKDVGKGMLGLLTAEKPGGAKYLGEKAVKWLKKLPV